MYRRRLMKTVIVVITLTLLIYTEFHKNSKSSFITSPNSSFITSLNSLLVQDSKWLEDRKDYILHYRRLQESEKPKDVIQVACKIPKLDAFHNDALRYMNDYTVTCPLKRYGTINNGSFILPRHGIRNVTVQYIRRATKAGEINKDNHVELSEKISLDIINGKGEYTLQLIDDFIKVEMHIRLEGNTFDSYHVEYHAHIFKNTEDRKTRKKLKDLKSGIPLNVIHLTIDSQSRANFERQLMKTMPVLHGDHNTIIFDGHTIVADGTTGQLTAAFTGTHEQDLPESRRGFSGSSSCDKFPWIFKDFNETGYSLLFTETDPAYAAFNLRLHGFEKPPTTHYTRAYWLGQYELDSHHYCNVKYNLHILREFTKTYEEEAKFAYVAMGRIAHNDMNILQVMDDDVIDMFRFYKHPDRIDNTMFILFSDHGARTHSQEFRASYQGKMEERLPFLSITLPPSFKTEYPKYFQAMKRNRKFLTSHYDLYATYAHILSHPKVPDQSKFIGKSLFTEINPLNRTCANSGIKDHWCSCLDFHSVSISKPEVIEAAKAVVDMLNNMINKIGEKSKKCAKLKFNKIISAGILSPNENVQKFIQTKRDDSCDSCGVVLNNDLNPDTMKSYEIKFQVTPGNGQFEANAKIIGKEIIVDPNISRMNEYGNDPKCILNEYPHLRRFCYCV